METLAFDGTETSGLLDITVGSGQVFRLLGHAMQGNEASSRIELKSGGVSGRLLHTIIAPAEGNGSNIPMCVSGQGQAVAWNSGGDGEEIWAEIAGSFVGMLVYEVTNIIGG